MKTPLRRGFLFKTGIDIRLHDVFCPNEQLAACTHILLPIGVIRYAAKRDMR